MIARDLPQRPIELWSFVAVFGAADALVREFVGDHPTRTTTDCLAESLALIVDGLAIFRGDPEVEANALRHSKNRSYHNHTVSVWRNLRLASKEICAFRLAIPNGISVWAGGKNFWMLRSVADVSRPSIPADCP
jgi:hypothetical protein